MAIPPFPCQDLAKLVLGYLIEEQLMTAYDEFLNESPYLDAQKNEYDRVMMNSLRNIIAEYRAIKIYVETCKPISLRRRLFQCSNLLEVVQFLVRYIDVKKLQEDLSRDRISFDSQEATTSRIGCDTCHSLKLESCVCSNKRRTVSSSKSGNNESLETATTSSSFAQATSLSDLPGNKDPENKNTRVLEHQTNQSSIINPQEVATNTYPVPMLTADVVQSSIIPSLQIQSKPNITASLPPNVSGTTRAMECSQNIAEFNTVLNKVCNVRGSLRNNSGLVAETFQDFTSGVRGAQSTNINIPDSSTTENINMPLLLPEKDHIMQNKRNVKTQQKKKCLYRVGNLKHDITEICSEVIDVDSVDIPANPLTNPKPEEQKVTILSNVRVASDDRPPLLSKNATSTPLLQMQTIYLNGTPIYTKPSTGEQKTMFTRDEIMAMPTIILVPATGPSNPPLPPQPPSQTVMAQSSNITTSTCHIAPTLPPLTIDVSDSPTNLVCNIPIVHNAEKVSVKDTVSSGPSLVKTVEALKNASVPKDNVVSDSTSTSTPHMLPPQRKSSSTPRRTSHVRVLDFTTPRRILNETITENPDQEAETENPVEIMISKSPNVSFPHGSVVADNDELSKTNFETDQINNTIVKASEVHKSAKKKTIIRKKSNWDADLRALVASSAGPFVENCTPSPKPTPKQKHRKKSRDEKETVEKQMLVNSTEKKQKKSSVKKNVSRTKHSKNKDKLETIEKPQEKVPSPTVSPISVEDKIITGEAGKVQNKPNDDEHIDTPEVERLSLRNEIGVKLNISDMLETPYKQALYEIQMETPRFLGPELPDDPMSDIKITDIPTPRFLSSNTPFTPKPTQATPSSYSSRPTDYSSGGSYYKPDDQDYLPILDDVACPVTSSHFKNISNTKSTEALIESTLKESQHKEKSTKRNRSRPVRQCTKNVSYYNSPIINKNTDVSKKDDVSSGSDTVSANSSLDSAVKDNLATPRIERIKQSSNSVNRKNLSLTKKRSPLKKNAQKLFMKIKPKRPTPTKDSGRKSCRKVSEFQVSLKGKTRVKITSKNKVSGSPSLVVPAPTKSRRKSSTPRKLHCTKTFNSESSGHDSPDAGTKKISHREIQNSSVSCVQDSDTEQLPLRWSDDGSQDTKLCNTENETDEISQIKEYIDKTVPTALMHKDNEGSLHNDLVKRGFDTETAKIIERDLLNTPEHIDDQPSLPSSIDETKNKKILERSVESDCSTLASNLIINDDDDADDFEFSVHECNEGSANYFSVQHDESNNKPPITQHTHNLKLKDKFTMEIGIDEGIAVRLIATPFNYLFNQDPRDSVKFNEFYRETEMAVSSISNIDKLYTPMKDPRRAQCYEIFDSTLTSIDTPLKADSPTRKQDESVSPIVLDVEEKTELKEKADSKKRKRLHCSSASEESVNDSKRAKPEAQFMVQTKDIKDMDIEVLLTKLHGS